jgi:hypothetical protein
MMTKEVDEKLLRKMIEESRKKLSLYPKIFDYSIGGYYHRKRWPCTRRYYQIKLLPGVQRREDLFEPILEISFRL